MREFANARQLFFATHIEAKRSIAAAIPVSRKREQRKLARLCFGVALGLFDVCLLAFLVQAAR